MQNAKCKVQNVGTALRKSPLELLKKHASGLVLGSGAAERIEFGNSASKLDFDQYKIKS